MNLLKECVLATAGKASEMDRLNSSIDEFAAMEESMVEERFVAQQKHTASSLSELQRRFVDKCATLDDKITIVCSNMDTRVSGALVAQENALPCDEAGLLL